jgi:hypothetical protein
MAHIVTVKMIEKPISFLHDRTFMHHNAANRYNGVMIRKPRGLRSQFHTTDRSMMLMARTQEAGYPFSSA